MTRRTKPTKEPEGGQPHEAEPPPLEAVVKAFVKKEKKKAATRKGRKDGLGQ